MKGACDLMRLIGEADMATIKVLLGLCGTLILIGDTGARVLY